MKSFNGPKTQNEVQSDDKLIWESFVSREDSEDTGRIPHDVDSFGTSTDQSNDFMNDQELLNPLHKAAQAVGADDINDWMIKQIKDQGDTWIEWFIDNGHRSNRLRNGYERAKEIALIIKEYYYGRKEND